MTLGDEQLQVIRTILRRHGISRAWLLETDPTELIVMLHEEDITSVALGSIEDELSSSLRPHRKVWLTEMQNEVTVQGNHRELNLRPVFESE